MPEREARDLRLFVACDLPREAQADIRAWQGAALGSRPELRPNHALHLTLCFLGDRSPEVVPCLVEALATVAWSPIEVQVEGALFLPQHGRRNVVALSVTDSEGALVALQRKVSDALVATGHHTAERRAWRPHLTVARYRRPGHPFTLQNVTIGGFCVVRMALYSSLLESTGAVHTPLAVFPAS